MAELGNQNRFLETLFKSRHQCLVAGRGPLEEDHLPDPALVGHLEQVVLAHRVQHRRQHIVHGAAFVEVVVDVAFHENGAAVAGHGSRAAFRSGGVVAQRAAQFEGLLFDKAAGAGGANRVHGGGGDHPVFQGGELGVLASDFDNGVHRRIQLAGRPGMGGDFIQHQVRAYQGADKFAARPGGAGAQKMKVQPLAAADIGQGFEKALDR